MQDWTTHEIDCTWPAAEGPAGLERALHRLCADADAAIAAGARFTLLTDRAAGAFRPQSLRAEETVFNDLMQPSGTTCRLASSSAAFSQTSQNLTDMLMAGFLLK